MDENLRTRSLRYSLYDGIFATIMFGFTLTYTTPYALTLKATNLQIGLLSAAVGMATSFVQFIAVGIADRIRNRVVTCVCLVISQATFTLPVAYLHYLNLPNPIFWLISLIVIASSFGALCNPLWISLMADTVIEDKRGEYFGWRDSILGAVGLIATFTAGMILNSYGKNKLAGFTLIFTCAAGARIISGYFLSKMYEPGWKTKKDGTYTYGSFIRQFPKNNFTKFVIYVSCLHFSVQIAVPFFPVLMLRDWKFSYLAYTIINVIAAMTSFLSYRTWGKLKDRFGAIKIARVCSLFIPFFPVMWIFSSNPVYLMVVNGTAAYLWAGFSVAGFNFVLDAVPPEKRSRGLAYFAFTVGVFACLGSLLGGWIINFLPPINGFPILTLFLISGSLRALAVILFLPGIKEVKPVETIDDRQFLFNIFGLNYFIGRIRGIFGWERE